MEMPPLVAVVCAHLHWLREQLVALNTHQKEIAAAERLARPEHLQDWELICVVEFLRRPLCRGIAEHRSRLVRLAAQQFAPQGAVLEIRDDVPREGAWEHEFDARAFWAALVERYGSSGAGLAFARTARKLKDCFRELRDGGDVKLVGGRPVLELPNYTGVWGYDFKESVRAVTDMLTAVAAWAAMLDPATVQGLDELRERAAGPTEKVTPHTKVVAPSLFIAVLFNTKIEFRLTTAFAEQLRVFLSSHGGSPESAQSAR